MKRVIEYKPYTYLIGWSKFDVWYYGSEYGKKSKTANPDNLWKTYFTTSKHVKKFRKENGEPDVIEVRLVFGDAHSTIKAENVVLRRLKVLESDRWLNRTDNKAIFNDEETQKSIALKCSEKLKGRPKTLEHIAKIKETKAKNPHRWSEDDKKRIGLQSANISVATRNKKSDTMSKKIWVRNETESRRIFVDEEIPEGYWKGRIVNHRRGLWKQTTEWKNKKSVESKSRVRDENGRWA